MKYVILGGGIAGLSLSSMLEAESLLLEKESRLGGLCRSFPFHEIVYDVGPHIIFSKHQEVLDLQSSLTAMNKLKRLNRIIIQGKSVKYPFENHLGMLEEDLKDECLIEFLHNPYSSNKPTNMKHFFLTKFGDGMTKIYFDPYNSKIWKYDSSYLDLQMVERIPNPPIEDVINGAKGNYKEGYEHQLNFLYPEKGGYQSVIDAFAEKARNRGHTLLTGIKIESIEKLQNKWLISTDNGCFEAEKLISTIPLPQLPGIVKNAHESILNLAQEMKYNSIHIVMMKFHRDRLEDQFALYIPNKEIIFHRLTRINFLGTNYGLKSQYLYLMMEITFRPNSYISKLENDQIRDACIKGLEELGIINRNEFIDYEIKTFEHAYVIYDLEHRCRTDEILNWAINLGITCHGRFGKFEYQNSDQVIWDSISLSSELNHEC